VVNFVIWPIAVADIALFSSAEALVRLELKIVLMVQFPHMLSLQNSLRWHYPRGNSLPNIQERGIWMPQNNHMSAPILLKLSASQGHVKDDSEH